jgi:hypothetical protein
VKDLFAHRNRVFSVYYRALNESLLINEASLREEIKSLIDRGLNNDQIMKQINEIKLLNVEVYKLSDEE